jgi:hypothetical protein
MNNEGTARDQTLKLPFFRVEGIGFRKGKRVNVNEVNSNT